MSPGVALAAGLACAAALVLVRWARRAGDAPPATRLAETAASMLERRSAEAIFEDAARASRALGAGGATIFRLAEATWEATEVGAGPRDATPIPERCAAAFSWFAHNPRPVLARDLATARLGAVAPALSRLFEEFAVEAALPLVDRRLLIGVIGLQAGPGELDREELERLRSVASAACANLALRPELAHAVDLEGGARDLEALRLALSPEPVSGEVGGLAYASGVRARAGPGSDFSLIRDGGGAVWLVVGDAAGSGLPAASIATAILSGLEVTIERTPEKSPAELLGIAAATLPGTENPARASCLAARWTPATGELEWTAAGHPAPYVIGPAGLRALVQRGRLLGDGPGGDRVERERLLPGELLFLYTNGVVDHLGEGEGELGHRRLQRLLEGDPDRSPGELAAAIEAALDEAGAELGDDLTYLAAGPRVTRTDRPGPPGAGSPDRRSGPS